MLSSRAVLIVDAGGIQIVEMLIESWEFLNKIVMAYLSLFKVEHGSMISNLISLRIRIATPPPCLLSLVFSLSSLVYIWIHVKNSGIKTSTFTREYVRHFGTWARKRARHVGMWARKHGKHVGTWARKHAAHVGTWVRF